MSSLDSEFYQENFNLSEEDLKNFKIIDFRYTNNISLPTVLMNNRYTLIADRIVEAPQDGQTSQKRVSIANQTFYLPVKKKKILELFIQYDKNIPLLSTLQRPLYPSSLKNSPESIKDLYAVRIYKRSI